MRVESGQVAVVTGAASGIGYAMAQRFGERGLSVVLADIEEEALDAATKALDERGVPVLRALLDVTDGEALEELAGQVLERLGRVDIVCNNAGVNCEIAPTWKLDNRAWKWVLDVNLWGVVNGIKAFVPHLVEQGTGHVVNTASGAGLFDVPYLGPYSASKFAIVGVSEVLWAELQDAAPGVGVTILCPGTIPTNLAKSTRNRPTALAPMHAVDFAPPPGRWPQTQPLAPEMLALEVIDAIESDALHLVTPAGLTELVRRRTTRLLANLKEP